MATNQSYELDGTDEVLYYYARIPIIVQRETSPIELAIYTNVVQTIGRQGSKYFKSQATIAKETHTSVASVKRAITGLKKLGFITVKSQGKGKANLIQLNRIYSYNTDYAKAETETQKQAVLQQIKHDLAQRELPPSSERATPPSSERATNKNSFNKNPISKKNTMSDKSDARLLPYVPQSISDQQADSITDIGNGKDPKPEPKPEPKPSDEGITKVKAQKDNAYELFKVIPKLLGLTNGRAWDIAHMLSGKKTQKIKDEWRFFDEINQNEQGHYGKMVSVTELEKAVQLYRSKNPTASLMQSPSVISDYVGRVRLQNKSKPKLSQEEIERRNRILATG